MGFGILFLGYFLLLNFAYPEYTDAISAAIMLYALYKLSSVNKNFKLAFFASAVFTVFGVFELGVEIYTMFLPISSLTTFYSITAILRHSLSAALTILMLLGMRDVSAEVGLGTHSKKCTYLSYATLAASLFGVLLEASGLGVIFEGQALAVMAAISILATLAVIALNLGAIYTCYMQICMPNEQNMERKKSKSALVESFRRHEEEKQREYAEYKFEKFKQKMNKRNKK